MRAYFRSALSIAWVVAVPVPSVWCKTPGEVHCYNLTCHRVLTIEETKSRVGSTRVLVASYYDNPRVDRSNTGALTSSGEKFDAGNSGRVASSIYPDGTELLLWNPLNGRTAHVRVNDFGPFRSNRTLDLTLAVARHLDVTRQGVTALLVLVVAPPPAEEPLYRSFRTYPKAKGYLGIYEEDALPAVARKLTADSESGDASELTAPAIAANIPVPVRKPTPRFGARDTVRAAKPPAETMFDAWPRAVLRSLPPLDTAVLLTPAPADKTNPQLALVVAADAGPRWRAPEVRIERLRFAGVWSGGLPRRSPLNLPVYFVAALMGIALLQRLTGATARAMRERRARAALGPPLRAPTPVLCRDPTPNVGARVRSSFIGPELQIQGCLISTSDVHVEGQIDGDCVCRQLVIKSAGRLTGDALAEEVIVSGALEGRILAKTVGLTSRAVVSGDINYCELIVERQATLEARMQRISRASWDETAGERPRMLPAASRAVA